MFHMCVCVCLGCMWKAKGIRSEEEEGLSCSHRTDPLSFLFRLLGVCARVCLSVCLCVCVCM